MGVTNQPERGWKTAKRKRIMETGFNIFSERGIEAVTMPEVAEASGVSRATLYRYFPTKLDLVLAIGLETWADYINYRTELIAPETHANWTAAEFLGYFLDSFIDLYRHHRDMLRFNYDLNSFMRKESGAAQVIGIYRETAVGVRAQFHDLFERGKKDGTIRTDLQEESMFSGPFHIMMAAITRYSVGLLYLTRPEEEERELVVLRDLLYDHMTVKREA